MAAVASPDTRGEMYSSLVDSLAKIHAVDPDAVGLGGYGKRRSPSDDISQTGYVARQVKVSTVTMVDPLCKPGCAHVYLFNLHICPY